MQHRHQSVLTSSAILVCFVFRFTLPIAVRQSYQRTTFYRFTEQITILVHFCFLIAQQPCYQCSSLLCNFLFHSVLFPAFNKNRGHRSLHFIVAACSLSATALYVWHLSNSQGQPVELERQVNQNPLGTASSYRAFYNMIAMESSRLVAIALRSVQAIFALIVLGTSGYVVLARCITFTNGFPGFQRRLDAPCSNLSQHCALASGRITLESQICDLGPRGCHDDLLVRWVHRLGKVCWRSAVHQSPLQRRQGGNRVCSIRLVSQHRFICGLPCSGMLIVAQGAIRSFHDHGDPGSRQGASPCQHYSEVRSE
nr:hypothetical protein CFP56_13019 [Quercus suber]